MRGLKMEIVEKAEELSNMIRESEEYKRYLAAKEAISADVDLYNRVNEYRKKNFTLQNSTSNNRIDELRELENEYREIMKNTIVREFLNSELILCRKMQKINELIVDGLDLDIQIV